MSLEIFGNFFPQITVKMCETGHNNMTFTTVEQKNTIDLRKIETLIVILEYINFGTSFYIATYKYNYPKSVCYEI